MAEVDWAQNIKDAEDSDLISRLDGDKDLYYLDSFTLKDSLSKTIPDVYNLRLPDARIFGDKVISYINQADIVTEIIGGKELNDKDIDSLESFLDDYYEVADYDLANMGIEGGLHGTHSSQSPIRGGVCTKIYPWMEKGKFHPGIVPWDRRFVTYESGINGLEWAAYKTERKKDKILAQYPDITVKADEAEVVDILTVDENIILIDGQVVKTYKHKFGFCPVVIVLNNSSAFLRDEGYGEHEGESIYASVRDLYDEISRIASVLQTHNMRSFQHNYQLIQRNLQGDTPTADFDPSPFSERTIIPMSPGEELLAMTPAELKNSLVYLLQLVESRMQMGTLPRTEYGDTGGLEFSAVAIKALGESRNSVVAPCLDTVARARKRMARMILDIWALNPKFKHDDITPPDTKVLKSKFKIDVHLSFIPPVENIANYAIAEEASKYMSRKTVLADILHVQNPQEVIQEKRVEEAELLSPQLKLYRTAKALIEEGNELEGAMIAGQIGLSIGEIKGNKADEQRIYAPKEAGQDGGNGSNPLVPLMKTGNRVAPGAKSSNQEAADMAKNMEVQ